MVTVHTGEKGFDSSFSHPPVQRTVDFGFTFRVGYISVPPASPGKNITLAECTETINAGQKLLLVYEMDAARPNLGATYGAIDGKNAALCAGALGCPTDVPILSAADLNSFVANIDRHEAYMRAFAANCGPWPMGIYGDTDILARCAGLWQIGWVPLGAWAWSGTSYADARAKAKAIGAHVLQHTGFYIDNTWAVDPNEAIADFPAWGLAVDPPTPPTPPSEDAMNYYVVTGANARFIGFPPQVTWTGPGSAKIDAAIATQLAAGNLIQVDLTGGPGAFASTFLSGPLPTGDTAYTWTGAEFAALLTTDVGTVDQTARAQIVALNDSVGRLGQEVHEVKTGLVKAGGG